ncbi:hypothetical protein SPRG_01534 [Saprolegnia parasitica CBS 223.65]|uniref:Uncharacterized protein n=1 Tax=Saprolegnia parasitica (strain CBS 223.65) TaxID=695850 RepID=A0A067CV56_SAPPC|nr:hypothetical protein SPRG_01534 [Saprolegnia parasitica CBS 223.65]KDO34398.1 hypothetical protein SPRG_01534 [Saprolegnia parasitica CBS 223.65]|eukprot:XP_012195133.1 hypothetical protein SPRG_01534 [Saprolegnia parasitica CBS 223.65]
MQLSSNIETATPFVLNFELTNTQSAMLVHDDHKRHAAIAEARFLLNGAEYIEFELASSKPRAASSPLYFGAVVHVVSKAHGQKRYLCGSSFRRGLRWSSSRSSKGLFRFVSQDHLGGPLQIQDDFCLQSVKWPSFYASFQQRSSTHALGRLVLKRSMEHAVAFSALNAMHREFMLSSLRHPIPRDIPTVYVSEHSFDTDIELDDESSDVGEAIFARRTKHCRSPTAPTGSATRPHLVQCVILLPF